MGVIKGSKDAKKYQVLKGQKDTRQIRCKRKGCNNLASQVSDGKGGVFYQCICGAKWTSTPI